MGGWRAVALPRVARADVQRHLDSIGVGWADACHVAATTTLTASLRDESAVALPVAALRDLVVLPQLPGEAALAVPSLRTPGKTFEADRTGYEGRLSEFQEQATGRRMRTGVEVDQSLRDFLREEGLPLLGRALLASRRSYAATVHTLVDAGLSPDDLHPTGEMAALAARAWARAERDVAALSVPRTLMAVPPDELAAGVSERAATLQSAIRAALTSAFGPVTAGDRRTLVHHGFYFYTPAQWQLFQALRSLNEVDQVFVVHDDQKTSAFAVWRYYFRAELGMPVPVPAAAVTSPTPAAAWLSGVLTGQPAGNLDGVRLVEYRSPVELVRDWGAERPAPDEPEQQEVSPLRFAARAEDVDRLVERLGPVGPPRSRKPNLSQLPIGSYLLTLHQCTARGAGGRQVVSMTPDQLLDLVASGYADDGVGRVPTPLLRRVLPFFEDCRSSQQWRDRADSLGPTVQERVNRMPARNDDDSDLTRIEHAAANPVRLASWVDLSASQAQSVAEQVLRVVRLVEEVLSRERVVLGAHLARVNRTLERALRELPEEQRGEIEARLRGFGVLTDAEIDVEGLVDVVAMLVGRSADVSPRDEDNEGDPASTTVKKVRGLDSLGLVRAETDVHVTNLAEDAFPTAGAAVGWPFTANDLAPTADGADPVVPELLRVRQSTGALNDLYLLWLALDGVAEGRQLTLSWISKALRENRRMSPLVALLSVLPGEEALSRAVPGLHAERIEVFDRGARGVLLAPPAAAAMDDDELDAVDAAVPKVAAASAQACPRRFALQWVLGRTAGFSWDHSGSKLFGNLLGALEKDGHENAFGALGTTSAVWPQLTAGQQATSRDRAVIKAGSASARADWVWTLGGSRDGRDRVSLAYQASWNDRFDTGAETMAPETSAFLPDGVSRMEGVEPEEAYAVCLACPVRSRCGQAQLSDR